MANSLMLKKQLKRSMKKLTCLLKSMKTHDADEATVVAAAADIAEAVAAMVVAIAEAVAMAPETDVVAAATDDAGTRSHYRL
jgi:hypothetical protein